MPQKIAALAVDIAKNARDFAPILAVVIVFQWLIVGEPMPHMAVRIGGILLTLVGLSLFIRGLDMSIFPLGQSLADGIVRRRSLLVLVVFGFAVGFGSTVAEPALAAVANQAAATAAAAGSVQGGDDAIARFAQLLRYTVSAAVGLAVAAGVLRILKGWPAAWYVLPGYGVAAVIALTSDSPLAAVAFDAGAAATSAVNIPLMMTLGTGLAALVEARDPLIDGFGLIAAASLMPMIVIQLAALALGA